MSKNPLKKLTSIFIVWIFITLAGCGGTDDNIQSSQGGEHRQELTETECQEAISRSTVAIITQNYLGYVCGTGIIIDTIGHILTNAHLVSTFAPVLVLNPATRELDPAIINGTSPSDDLAVLRVNEHLDNYKPSILGKSTELSPDDEVYTFGYITNSNETISEVYSVFKKTKIYEVGAFYDYYCLNNMIKIDTILDYENSGGPIINKYGEVVGIMSIGFMDTSLYTHCIPMETVKEITTLLLEGNIKNIGAGFVPNNIDLANKYGTPYLKDSLIITSMEKGSPLYETGWYRFDLLCQADGVKLCYPGDLLKLIKAKAPGEKISLSGIGLYEDDVYRPYETTISVP